MIHHQNRPNHFHCQLLHYLFQIPALHALRHCTHNSACMVFMLPSSLTHLTLGNNFNYMVDNRLPPSLVHLSFQQFYAFLFEVIDLYSKGWNASEYPCFFTCYNFFRVVFAETAKSPKKNRLKEDLFELVSKKLFLGMCLKTRFQKKLFST